MCARMKQLLRPFLRTIIPVNQLSIYGAVADVCEEFGQTLIDPEKTYAVMEPSESMVAPTGNRDQD